MEERDFQSLLVEQDVEIAVGAIERRQLNEFDSGRRRRFNRSASGDQHHCEILGGQRLGENKRALQMPDAQQMLDMNHHPGISLNRSLRFRR